MPLIKERETPSKQLTASIKSLPHFFDQKKIKLKPNHEASDPLHDVKEFSDASGTWMVKDINANGRERYDTLSPKIKALLLQAEMMHSELFNFLSGIDGPHYRVILNEQQEVIGLASEKVNKVADFINWLRRSPLNDSKNQQTLRQYFQLLTAQLMIEDPDPNPYNIMVSPKGLVKIDEGWASYQLLLSIMQRPTPFEHDIKNMEQIKTIGKVTLSNTLANFPIGRLIQQFLPKFLQAIGYWFVQRTIINEACKPLFTMDFKTLHQWILNQENNDSTLLEKLITPTLVYHFVTTKCSNFLDDDELKQVQNKCHQLIEQGLIELMTLVKASLKTWLEKLLLRSGLLSVPSAKSLESESVAKVIFQFTSALIHETESQVCSARQQIAKQYDLTLQFYAIWHIERTIIMLPWIKKISSGLMRQIADNLSKDYYLTATFYLLTDLTLIKRAALLSRMKPEETALFINYHQNRQQQYRKRLKKDLNYRLYLYHHTAEIEQTLKKRLELFTKNNPFYEDLNLNKSFTENFTKWRHEQNNLFEFTRDVLEHSSSNLTHF